jgi:hypothetical protein
MVDAAARVDVLIDAADLHLVGAAGIRADAERAEHRLGLDRLDAQELRASAPAAQLDLLRIGGAPSLRRRRPVEHGAGVLALTRAFFSG